MHTLGALLPPAAKAWLRRRRERRSIERGNRPADPARATDSFGALVDDRERWLFATLPRPAAELHWDIFAKSSQKRLARRLGVEVAKDFVIEVPLREAIAYVEGERLDRFVIKPVSSYSSLGCRSLIRDGDRYRDLRTGRRRRLGQWLRELEREQVRGRRDRWLVEELLVPVDGSLAPIEDYKFYCFGGQVELIVHKWAVPGPAKFEADTLARDWTPVDVGLEHRHDAVARAPLNGERLVAVAERTASGLCYPFIRIDLYDTTRGIVLGEFTPGPGRAYGFNEAWNDRLVRRWHEAAAEIEDGVRTGRITPLSPDGDPAVLA